MRRRSRFRMPQVLLRPAVFLLTLAMNAWLSTLSMRFRRYHPDADPGDTAHTGPAIYIFWHEYLLMPFYLRPHCGLTMLASQHQDADVLAALGQRIGMGVIRGSTYRGAITALRKLVDTTDGESLVITPDGPRGPRRALAQGCIFLSSRLQIPLVLLGFGFDRPWRFQRAWDKFALPKPFSRCRVIMSPRIQVPAGLGRDELEQHRAWIEQQLNELTELAEEWAENRCSIEGSENLYRHSYGHLKNACQRLSSHIEKHCTES